MTPKFDWNKFCLIILFPKNKTYVTYYDFDRFAKS